MSEKNSLPQWAGVAVKLLQGPVYRTNSNDSTWNLLKTWNSDIQDYFSKIGVFVFVEDSDGYAFLKQKNGLDEEAELGDDEDAENENTGKSDIDYSKIPRLIKSYPLSMELSLLCVILREALDQFDTSQDSSSMLVMKESEIKDRLVTFMPEKSDQTRVYSKMDEYLNRLVDLTFLRELKRDDDKTEIKYDREFEVRRIIRGKVNAEFLEEFKKRLEEVNRK